MEVHHKHHVPKNINEYLTEFLMLFAAVTLGFFVENMREHYVEDHRGQVYAQRLLEDLKEDSIRLDNVYNSADEKVKLIASIIPFVQDEKKIMQLVDSFYYFGFWGYNKYGYVAAMPRFYRVEETVNELSAGNLRLIKSDSVVSNLAAYSRRYKVLNQVIDDFWQERSENLSKLHMKMFDKTFYLLHDKEHPKTYPIFYKDISKENIYTLKIELLSYKINMEALQLNVISLRKINKRLMSHLRAYIQI
jgi:hypothetical protein